MPVFYKVYCPQCDDEDEYELKDDNVFGDQLILTHWPCNDVHIVVGGTHTPQYRFRGEESQEKFKGVVPKFSFRYGEKI